MPSSKSCTAARARDRRQLDDAIELAAPGVPHAFVLRVVADLLKTDVVTCAAFLAFEAEWNLDWIALNQHCEITGERLCGLDRTHVFFTSADLKARSERAREPLVPDWTRRNRRGTSTSGRN